MENQEFASLKVDIEKSLKTIEQEGTGVKSAVKKLEEQFATMNKEMDQRRLREKSHRLFGTYSEAYDFVNILRNAVEKSGLSSKLSRPTECPLIQKSDLNTWGTGAGVELVPTATASTISLLLSQGGVARRECKVIEGLTDKLVLPIRNGHSTAAFTASSGTLKDDLTVNSAAPTVTKVTLSPSQIANLVLVSEKLLYMSAVNIAEFVAIDMIEQAGVLEDNCVIRGDGTNAYGNITGVNANGSVNPSTVAFGSFDLSNVLKLPGTVAEAAQMSPDAKFYMSGAVLSILRSQKTSGSGQFYFDPAIGGYTLSGYPIVIWHRMDNTIASGKFPVYFGDFKKAVVLGIGRDYNISVDHSFAFGSVQAAFRLAYDFDAQFIQPTALGSLECTIS